MWQKRLQSTTSWGSQNETGRITKRDRGNKVRQVGLQSVIGITKCEKSNYNVWQDYKVRRYSVKEIIISSVFMKKLFKSTRIIREINDCLRKDWDINIFFVDKDNATKEYFQKDGNI